MQLLRWPALAIRQFETFWLSPCDARIYALIRISFAGAALLNLALVWPHRFEALSDVGMVDHAAWQRSIDPLHYYSVFSFIRSKTAITLYLALSGAAMLSLGLGLFSRAAIIWVCVFQISYSYRIFLMAHGWDTLLRVTAFALMISPLGAAWSVDAWLKKRRARQKSTPQPPTLHFREHRNPELRLSPDRACGAMLVSRHGLVLLQVELFIIYWSAVWMKLGNSFWRSGDMMAYYYMSQYSRLPSIWFADQYLLSQLSTYFALFSEMWLPFLLSSRRGRRWGFLLGILLHGGIALASPLILFSWAMLTLYPAFMRSDDIEALASFFRRLRPRVPK